MRIAALSLLLAAAGSALALNPPITVNVDAGANRHAIDPRIYGAAWASSAEITTLGLTLNRWGGNAMSRYNWIYSTANRCKDYYFYNIPEGGANGASADAFIQNTFNAGAEPVMTIPMISLLPKDAVKRCSFPTATYPNQEATIFDEISCGNGRTQDNDPTQDGPRILGIPDPSGIATSYPLSHQGDWVQHLVDTWGAAPAGVRHYSLDNEPHLWSFDHWDVHPDGTTYDEVWGKMEELGAIIRAKDPNAIITGGEEWGWSGYFDSGIDAENQNDADRQAHGGVDWYDWMLQQAKAHHDTEGVRIFDVLTAHFYPQSGEFWSGDVSDLMQNLRNRSTRSLWDPTYSDESWISDTCGPRPPGCFVQLIPRLKQWVADNYPGTQIGITEYNWGDIAHINGATTQADILGIFGREGLDVGVRWSAPAVGSFVGNAFRMYRNYDGAGGKFGNTSVYASAPNVDEISAFAAERSSDGALTIMIVAKTLGDDTPVTVSLANFTGASPVQRWQLSSANVLAQLANLTLAGNSITLTVPKQSITLLVVPHGAVPAAPTITATAVSTTSVELSWSAVANAINYNVERSSNGSAFAPLLTLGATTHTDSGLQANTAYLYRVRANVAAGATNFSTPDVATTTVFTDPTLPIGTPVKLVHFTQLRTAVNAVRHAAGLGDYLFADVLTTATHVRAVHLTQLREALAEARADIGLTAIAFTDPSAGPGTTIERLHVTELRDGVK